MIAIESKGRGSRLVLLHGVGTSRVVWRQCLPSLAVGRRVLAVDLPGFGESPPVGEGFELDQVADAIADALEPPYDLLGHSLGGAVAFTLARRHPDAVSRLILSAPAGFTRASGLPAAATGTVANWLLQGRRVVGRPLAGSQAARRVLLWGAVANPAALAPGEARLMLDAPRGATRIAAAIATALRSDLRAELPQLEVPLGLIWGDRDAVVPIDVLAALRAYAQPRALETIPDAGHVPQLEHPAAFSAAVGRLLERLVTVTIS